MPPTGGGGGGGLSTVSVSARLSGNGTAGSPLDIAGLPLIYSWFSENASTNARAAGNQVSISGFTLGYALTFSKLTIKVTVADAVNSYDFGIYTKAGALIANVGAQTVPSTGQITFNTVQGAQTIAPGLYAFGWTGNAATTTITWDINTLTWISNQNVAASAGGALPASIGALAVAPAVNAWQFSLS